MKYLVTGGAGFIGSHIVESLVQNGNEVRVLDNLSTGNYENLKTVSSAIEFTEGDICDLNLCMNATEGCDGIFHEAALVSVVDSIERPQENHDINITGTMNVLEAARTQGCKRIAFASSAAIYGNNPELPKNETMLPEPLSPYGSAKIAGEYLLQAYAEQYGIGCVALRYFNVAGCDPGGRIGQSTKGSTLLVKVAAEAAVGKRDKLYITGTDFPTDDGTGVRRVP